MAIQNVLFRGVAESRIHAKLEWIEHETTEAVGKCDNFYKAPS